MDHPRLVPAFIMQQYEAGQQQGSMEAGCLFVDISGFTAVNNTLVQQGSEALEAVADIMHTLWEPLVAAVYEQGGFITGFAGDAFTALFPLHDDDALTRMVHTAQTIHQHIAQNPTQRSRYGTFPFAVKLGLELGQVEWGIIQPDQPGLPATYFFSGPAIDGAAEAEHQAQKGFIVLNKALVERLGDAITGQPLEEGAIRLLKSDLPAPSPPTERPFQPQATTIDAFIPASVQKKTSRGEFRPVISVFVNLMGISTPAQLRIFMQSVFTLQSQYGGYLSSVDFGDKGCNLLLFWGMPTTHANDLTRALSFVLDIPTITPGTFKVGITLRTLYAGFTGSSIRSEYSCYGDGVNLAARLMVGAPWGDVWMESRVAAKAAAHFHTEGRGEHTFKGFDTPQPVTALLGHREEAAIFHTPFTGRDTELEHITGFIQQAQTFASVLIIEGETGLGKSRLTHETTTTPALLKSHQVFVGKADELTAQSLGPFRYWLHRYCDQSPEHSDALNKQAFNRKLDQVISRCPDAETADELNRLRSCLGDLLGLHWENSLFTQLDPEARRNTVLLALRALLRAESLIKPVVFVLEDLHAADPATVGFVESLPHRLEGYPLAVLVTQQPWDDGLEVERMTLARLTEADMRDIAESVLGGRVAEEIVTLVTSRSDGNPFFAEQILFYLKEANAFSQLQGEWRLIKQHTQTPLPYDIRGIFNARLDALPNTLKDLVQVAAILGREFTLHFLTRLTGNTPAVLKPLLEAGETEAIWAALDDMTYLFQSSLLRDAAYQMQLQSQRRELHYQAALAIEDVYQEEKDDAIDWIAHHYAAAVEQGLTAHRDRAVEALRVAGQQAVGIYDNRAARSHFTRAISLLSEGDSRLVELYFAREECLSTLGDRDAQYHDLTALERLLEQADQPEWRSKLLWRKAQYQLDVAQHEQAVTLAHESLSLAQVINAPRMEVLSILVLANGYRRQAQHEQALHHLNAALSIIQQTGPHDDLKAQVLNFMGLVEAQRGNFTQAQTFLEQALTHYRETNDLNGQFRCLSNLGTLRLNHNQYRLSLFLYQQALEVAVTRGSLSGQSAIYNNMAWTSILIGQLADALRYLGQSIPLAREIQDKHLEAYGSFNSATAAYLQGDFDKAATNYEQATAMATELNLLILHADSLVGLGDVAFAREHFSESIAHYQAAIAVREEAQQAYMQAEAQTRLALVHIAQGDDDQARTLLEAVEVFVSEGGDLDTTDYPIRVHFNLAQIYAVFGSAQAAAEEFKAAHVLLKEQMESLAEEEMRAALRENIPWHHAVMTIHQAVKGGANLVRLLLDSLSRETVSEHVSESPPPQQPDDDMADLVTPSIEVDASTPTLQEAREHIAFLEGRLTTYREQLQQTREDYKASQHEVKELSRQLGRAEATIDMLQQRLKELTRSQ
jgi:predicted ATPase